MRLTAGLERLKMNEKMDLIADTWIAYVLRVHRPAPTPNPLYCFFCNRRFHVGDRIVYAVTREAVIGDSTADEIEMQFVHEGCKPLKV